MEFKGTKGKWTIEPGFKNKKGAWIGNDNGYTALSCGNTDDEASYNAQLIAHAPEMLEMLSRVNDRLIRRALPTEREVNEFAKDIQDLLTRATTI